jgi:hypothetical protein
MRRSIFVGAIFGATLVLLAGPAGAKGIGSVHFTGPGLPPGGITISGAHQEIYDTGVLGGPRSFWTPAKEGISKAELGPAYQATYQVQFPQKATLRQTIYPYASEGGAWAYTPPGQSVPEGGRIEPGWASTDTLRDFLVKHGFPRVAPHVAVQSSTSDSHAASAGLWAALGAALFLLLVLPAGRIRRRARR